MKSKFLIILAALGLSLNCLGGSTMTPDVSDLPVVVAQVSNLTVEVATKVASNELANTTLGNEGIRRVGALGGYDLEEFIKDTSLRGPSRDYTTFTYSSYPATDLSVTNTGGDVYSPEEGYIHLSPGTATLTDNSVNYAYWNNTPPKNIVKWTTTRPNVVSNIVLGVFVTAFGSILEVDPPEAAGDFPLNTRAGASQIAPSLVVNGLEYSATGTALSNVFMSAGIEYHDMRTRKEHSTLNLSSSNVSLVAFGRTNTGVWASTITNIVPVGKWDNGSNIVDCVSTNWYKGLFLSLQNSQKMLYIYPQAEYTNETDAIAGFDPTTPPGFTPYIPMCTEYVFQGSDTVLRVESQYWVDRRFQIRRPGTSSSSGGSSAVPSLDRVMIAGSSLGGILPHDAGDPTDSDQLTSKHYVDSTINNVNAQRAYVDINGNDTTALLESSILPFKTIQKAIDTAGSMANETNRYVVTLSPGEYVEDITMSNYVSMVGVDIPSTFIIGHITFPTNYIDATGSEIGLLSVRESNGPALILNAGSDTAYIGIRSCALYSDYTDENITNKSVVLIERGLTEMSSTTYNELNVLTTNGFIANAQIFEHTTDPLNIGLSQFTSFSSSSIINCADTNDDVSMMFTHDNTDSGCINEMIAGNFNIHLDTDATDLVHNNNIKLVSHKRAIGRSLSMGNATRLYMDTTNNCNLFIAFSADGTGDNVAISRNNHIRVVSGSSSNVWFGAAVGTNDNIRIYDTEIIQNNAFNVYPRKYTALGSLGDYYINTPHQNGDQILGGALDLSALSTSSQTIPESGHVRMYANTYAGLENVMFQDSSGNIGRMARDNFFNGYNSETTTLRIGEAIYVSAGLSADQTPIVKRCDASDPSTLPCDGIVVQVGNIATGTVGRIMRAGRTESTFNTSAFTSGDKLYVPVKINGLSMVTNVAPNGSNIVQIVGKVHLSGANGKMTVYTWKPDTLGGRVPQDYTTYDKPIFSASQFMITNSGSAKISVSDIPAGTTNTYILPAVGGTLATYTDIQLVPVSAIVGEIGGIQKGRVVYQSGVVSNRPQVKYADRRYTDNLPIIGVATASGDLGNIIEIANFGPVNGMDTSSFETGDMMYLGTNGAISLASSVSSEAIIMMGTCLTSDAVTGSMLVNIRSYFQDGSFAGSMRYSVKNASTSSNAVAAIFAINDTNEAVRMVIRGSGNTRGRGAIISTSANGPFWYSNNRRQSLIWDIDMKDTGDEFTHLNWPMMALVPQIATSNAFFGIGTTNPLTMLDVRGSISSSNSFRLSNNGYSVNEHITYGASTNLIGILNTSLQNQVNNNSNIVVGINTNLGNQITTTSNTLYGIDTNLQNQVNNNSNVVVGIHTNLNDRINTETNRAIQAEIGLTNAIVANYTNLNNSIVTSSNTLYGIDTNLQNQITANSNIVVGVNTNLGNRINTETNRAYIAETNLQAQITAETNRAITAETSLTNFVVSVSNNAYIADTNLSARINAETNRAYVAETNLQGQVSSATNRIQNIENQTNTWSSSSTKFLANIGTTFNYTLPQPLTRVLYTNLISNVGGTYSNSAARWIPGVSNVFVQINGSIRITGVANDNTILLQIYKNGLLKSTIVDKTIRAGTFGETYTFTDITTNSADYYEVWSTLSNARSTIGSGADNWWSGQIVY